MVKQLELGQLSFLFHEQQFNFAEAFAIDQQRLQLDLADLSAQCDFAEKHFTTGRVVECEQLLAALLVNLKLEIMKLQYEADEQTVRLVNEDTVCLGNSSPIPEAYLFNPTGGNSPLASQRAQHYIVGIEHPRAQLMLRVETNYKPYQHLVIRDHERNYANRGEGEAHGLDLFVKYGAFLQTRFNAWMRA